MDPELREEALRIVRSARQLLAGLAEEADGFGPAPAVASATAPPEPEPAPAPSAPSAPSASPASPASPASQVPEPTPTAGPARVVTPGASALQTDLLGDAPVFEGRPQLSEVRESLGECTRCRLSEGRSRIVFGDGDPDAELMFVGEGPGEQEDLQGLPFVGRAGELLTKMIERGLGIERSAVYICNIVKCRPPGNRTPLADEVSACRPFLDAQIDAVAPKVIVALGKPAASLLLGRDVSITRIRGTWHDYRGTPLMPTFHPAFVLRQYTEENRRLVWEDLKQALGRTRE